MIYLTLGTQKFEFNRLLKYVENAIDKGIINDDVYAQVGYSTYKPKNYNISNFVEKDRVEELIDECEYMISHGGSGNIIDALNKNKKIIVVPRDASYKEHIDNHQFELVNKFYKEELILKACNEEEFIKQIKIIKDFNPKGIDKLLNNGAGVKKIIDEYLEKMKYDCL